MINVQRKFLRTSSGKAVGLSGSASGGKPKDGASSGVSSFGFIICQAMSLKKARFP